jgi:hypothetical protein
MVCAVVVLFMRQPLANPTPFRDPRALRGVFPVFQTPWLDDETLDPRARASSAMIVPGVAVSTEGLAFFGLLASAGFV